MPYNTRLALILFWLTKLMGWISVGCVFSNELFLGAIALITAWFMITSAIFLTIIQWYKELNNVV